MKICYGFERVEHDISQIDILACKGTSKWKILKIAKYAKGWNTKFKSFEIFYYNFVCDQPQRF